MEGGVARKGGYAKAHPASIVESGEGEEGRERRSIYKRCKYIWNTEAAKGDSPNTYTIMVVLSGIQYRGVLFGPYLQENANFNDWRERAGRNDRELLKRKRGCKCKHI